MIMQAPEILPALGHNIVTTASKEPTCLTTGLTSGSSCSNCGKVYAEQEVVPMLSHKTETVAGKAATCTTAGLTNGVKCILCNQVLEKQVAIPALGHTVESKPAVEATCTSSGLTVGKECSTCGFEIMKQQSIPALGHSGVSASEIPATCTSSGVAAGVYCATCGVTIEGREEISALGHKIVNKPAVAPTCTQSGMSAGSSCSVCLEVFSAPTVIPALGHNVVNNKCTICGVENVTPYENYTQASLENYTPAAGSVIRIYKTENSDYDGNFISIKGTLTYTLADNPSETRTQDRLYLGRLNSGELMIGFEPISGSLAGMKLTSENTNIKIYETEEFIDIAFMEGNNFSFNGVSLYGSTMTGTLTIDSSMTLSKFSGEIYLLNAPANSADSEVI
jgi:hypothetical protein